LAKKSVRRRSAKKTAKKTVAASEPAPPRPNKDFSNARDMFRIGDFDAAVAVLERLVRREPSHLDALALLASCYSFQERYEEAVKCHEAAVEASPADAQRWQSLAADLLNLGDLDRAEEAVRRAMKLDGRRGSTHYSLARIVARRGDHDGALTNLRKALELQPELRDSIVEQPDFAPLAEDDRFKQLARLKRSDLDYPFFEREEA